MGNIIETGSDSYRPTQAHTQDLTTHLRTLPAGAGRCDTAGIDPNAQPARAPAAGQSGPQALPVPPVLHRRADASIDHATQWRNLLATWGRQLGIPSELLADMELAAYEALANAAMHAYPAETTGPMSLIAQIVEPAGSEPDRTASIVIEVRDQGRWNDDPDGRFGDRIGGYGVRLIRLLAPEATITSSVTGTHVRLVWPWTPQPTPPAPVAPT